MSVYSDVIISDRDLPLVETDKAVKFFAPNDHEWLFYLQKGDLRVPGSILNDIKHHWINDVEGYVKTTLTSGMTGGASSETISVSSTANFVAGNCVVIARNGSNAQQLARITAIGSSTSMTIAAISGNLSNHANGTSIILASDWTKYGDAVYDVLRLGTRDSNTVEQISVRKSIPSIQWGSELVNRQRTIDALHNDMMSLFRQKLTAATLFGVESEADAGGTVGYGKTAGAWTIIATDGNHNDGTDNFTKPNLREFIMAIVKRGGFPGRRGTLVHNAEFLNGLYSWDDSSDVQALVRDREHPFDQIRIFGVVFDMVYEKMMDDVFPDHCAGLFLTPRSRSGPCVRYAAQNGASLDQKTVQHVLESGVSYDAIITMNVAMEVRNAYLHGAGLWQKVSS